MAEITVKEKFHQLIDKFQDVEMLENIYEALSAHQERKKDILDDLTPEQLQRLEESLQQSYEGKVVPHSVVRENVEKWLKR